MSQNEDMFARRLKELRTEKNLTQAALAAVLNVDRTAVIKWENGERETSFAMLIKIADYFDVTLDYLLGRTMY